MNEVQSAMERLRLIYAGTDYRAVYGNKCSDQGLLDLQKCDEDVLVDAYLAEHHADEDWPLTLDWAEKTIGPHQVLVYGDWCWVLGMADVGSSATLIHRHNETGEFWAMYMGGLKLQMMVNRGDLRRLMAAIGVPLKESKSDNQPAEHRPGQ